MHSACVFTLGFTGCTAVRGLLIDAGRQQGVPWSERNCDMYSTGVVGDDSQLVFLCMALFPAGAHAMISLGCLI